MQGRPPYTQICLSFFKCMITAWLTCGGMDLHKTSLSEQTMMKPINSKNRTAPAVKCSQWLYHFLLYLYLYNVRRIHTNNINHLDHYFVFTRFFISIGRSGQFDLLILFCAERLPVILKNIVARPQFFYSIVFFYLNEFLPNNSFATV